jgi:cation diffusion facilitator CzcD-associated flavoprotein CzcO
MYRYLFLLLSSHIVLSTSTDLPVCIIGAGASGLSAAHALEALGRRTVIFEAKETVGGNAQNYYEKYTSPEPTLLSLPPSHPIPSPNPIPTYSVLITILCPQSNA